jgi:hypothetical protein
MKTFQGFREDKLRRNSALAQRTIAPRSAEAEKKPFGFLELDKAWEEYRSLERK